LKRDLTTFYLVRDEHSDIHEALLNWARLVKVHAHSQAPAPMFRHYKSTEVWIADEPKIPINRLDGWKMEREVQRLPEKNRDAVRWYYVFPGKPPGMVARRLGLTVLSLQDHVHNARSMLRNRGN
jgi:DNA-directed RNA polymerase specialized sigma24 family protein